MNCKCKHCNRENFIGKVEIVEEDGKKWIDIYCTCGRLIGPMSWYLFTAIQNKVGFMK